LAFVHPGEVLPAASVDVGGSVGPRGNLEIHFHAGAMMGSESEARSFARLIHKYLREETRTRAVGITV